MAGCSCGVREFLMVKLHPLARAPIFANIRIVLQNSKNGLERFFREKSNQATIADRCVLKRATEVAGEFIASCCGPPHDYSIAAPTAQKICLQRSKKSFATQSRVKETWHGRRQTVANDPTRTSAGSTYRSTGPLGLVSAHQARSTLLVSSSIGKNIRREALVA
jgi:hypothetical protein